MRTAIQRLGGGLVAALLLLAFTSTPADASHFRFSKIECVPTGTAGEVSCDVTIGYRTGFFFGSTPAIGTTFSAEVMRWGDGTFDTIRPSVRSVSPAQGIMIVSATLTHTYANSGSYEVGFQSCCRIAPLNNRRNQNYRIYSTIEVDASAANAIDPNPVTSVAPVTGFPQSETAGTPARITLPANDPDGESLACRLATDIEAGGGPSPAGMTVNPDCTIDWDNASLATGLYTVQVQIEELDGGGSPSGNRTVVDFILNLGVDTGTAPQCTFDVASPYVVNVGGAVSFTVTGADADAGDTIELSAVTVPAFGTMSPSLPITGAAPQASTFSGTAPATPGQAFATYSVTDDAGNTANCDLTVQYVPVTTGLTCSKATLLAFGDYDIDGNDADYGEFAELANGEEDDVDLTTCSFATFDPLTEQVIYTAPATGSVSALSSYYFASMNGDQPIPAGSISDGPVGPDRPGALVLLEGATSVGATVQDVLPNVVAGLVYRNEDDVYAAMGGGASPAQRDAFLAAFGQAVAGEDEAREVDVTVAVAPNPLRGQATVTFSVSAAADVRVSVYDALGREVALLADAPLAIGEHDVTFDARDLPAGVYVIRAQVGAEARTTRVTVAR